VKRRDFLKTSAAAGLSGIGAAACSTGMKRLQRQDGPGFDLHPFVRANPEAVFIARTSVDTFTDAEAIRGEAFKLSRELFVRVPSGGYPDSARITVKPNWTSSGKPVPENLGINTDPNFIEGFLQAMKETGPQRYYIRESARPSNWESKGWTAMAERNGFDFRDLSTKDYWELGRGDIHFVDVPDDVVFRRVGYQSPINEPDTFLVNIAKMKSHGMGITATIKNLQGVCGKDFHKFCTPTDVLGNFKRREGKRYGRFFQKNFEAHVRDLHARHLKEGYPRWDRPEPGGGLWMEQWVQRALDNFSVTPTGINIVEGVYSRDGNGFGRGPHPRRGDTNVTAMDYMSNIVIFGIDPFRVDIVTHWLAGHEPGNFGLFHIGIERGFSDVLDPFDIPVYAWKDGSATLAKLDDFERTPLLTYYLQRDYGGREEPRYHLCDEPFDYSAWKRGSRVGDCTPSIRELGRDGGNRTVMGITLPRKDDVYVEVRNSRGELVWKLIADDLDAGVHQVVWDNFDSPGLYGYYVKGMGWDAEARTAVFS